MSLTKVPYTDNVTVIGAQNLNDIQDAILDLEDAVEELGESISDSPGSGYEPPAGGIPRTDLASDVVASLGKADNAVQSVSGKGLSSEDYTSEEKTKLAGIESGAQVNTITGVKGNAETNYRVGNVNITKANIGLENVENKSSATIRGELTSQNVIDALGYTPSSSAPGITYEAMTESEAVTGTATTAKVVSAKTIMSAIESKGYTSNTGTITGITMNGASKGTSGVIDLGTVITDISGKVDKVTGKGLSTNDYTNADKAVVDGIKNLAYLEYEVVT